VIGKMEMLGGVEDDGVINLISYEACLANFIDLHLGVGNGEKIQGSSDFKLCGGIISCCAGRRPSSLR
jgi:hypothetical protein